MSDMYALILASPGMAGYPLFKDYCRLKDQGLRQASFQKLDAFLQKTREWEQAEKRVFVSRLFSLCETAENSRELIVYPLEQRLLKPVLERWMKEKDCDARPFKWHGLFLSSESRLEYLEAAFEKSGKKDQQVLEALMDFYSHCVWYSFHHIAEDAYLGEIEEDRQMIQRLKALHKYITDEERQNGWKKAIAGHEALLNDWTAFISSGQTEGFAEWCEEKGKAYSFTQAFYYDA
ncbi:hypothetical protein [Pseudobacillus badius]|uniref:hypothetical protein n=1 Tax=Bacillus badius TaxID=1455 RepID=UPI0007B3A182|nr:hypothetical protein [Bacillus badius]KZR58609.1 hypothetical protein A3781_16200 [Bacillus badius]